MSLIPHNNAVFLLNQSVRIILDRSKISVNQIERYNASYQVASIFQALSTAYTQSIVPYVYDFINKGEEIRLRTLFFISQIFFN